MYMNAFIAAAIVSYVAAVPLNAARDAAADPIVLPSGVPRISEPHLPGRFHPMILEDKTDVQARDAEPILLRPGEQPMAVPRLPNGEPRFSIKVAERDAEPEAFRLLPGEHPVEMPTLPNGLHLQMKESVQARDAEPEAYRLLPGESPHPVRKGPNGEAIPMKTVEARDAEAEAFRLLPGETPIPQRKLPNGEVLSMKTVEARDAEAEPMLLRPGEQPMAVPRLPNGKPRFSIKDVAERDAEAEPFMLRPGEQPMHMPHAPNGRPLAVSKLAERDGGVLTSPTRFRGHGPEVPRNRPIHPLELENRNVQPSRTKPILNNGCDTVEQCEADERRKEFPNGIPGIDNPILAGRDAEANDLADLNLHLGPGPEIAPKYPAPHHTGSGAPYIKGALDVRSMPLEVDTTTAQGAARSNPNRVVDGNGHVRFFPNRPVQARDEASDANAQLAGYVQTLAN